MKNKVLKEGRYSNTPTAMERIVESQIEKMKSSDVYFEKMFLKFLEEAQQLENYLETIELALQKKVCKTKVTQVKERNSKRLLKKIRKVQSSKQVRKSPFKIYQEGSRLIWKCKKNEITYACKQSLERKMLNKEDGGDTTDHSNSNNVDMQYMGNATIENLTTETIIRENINWSYDTVKHTMKLLEKRGLLNEELKLSSLRKRTYMHSSKRNKDIAKTPNKSTKRIKISTIAI